MMLASDMPAAPAEVNKTTDIVDSQAASPTTSSVMPPSVPCRTASSQGGASFSARASASQAATHAAAAAEFRAAQETTRGLGDVTKVLQQAATTSAHVARGVDGLFGASRAAHLREQL